MRNIALLLGASLLLGGCGAGNAGDVPELIEPAAVNDAYRPVEYGTIGKVQVLYGTVTPEDYCHFYDANVSISEITVEVGDVVEAGDILAYADMEAASESLSSLREQLDNENAVFDLNSRISQAKRNQWGYLKQQAANAGQATGGAGEENGSGAGEQAGVDDGSGAGEQTVADSGSGVGEQTGADSGSGAGEQAGADSDAGNGTENGSAGQDVSGGTDAVGAAVESTVPDYDTMIAVEAENARYDAMLHEYRVAKLQESIAELEEIVADGTLVARHGGQVTYTKNIAKGRVAGANENIVVVSDLDDLSIEVQDTNVQNYKYSDYEVKYITVAGEKVPVTELSYSAEELILAKVNSRFPNVRFQCPEGIGFAIGDMYPVYFIEKDVADVLVVGNDSIYTENGERYVYVLNEDGEQEKRVVELGAADENYSQVKDGLSEGELVYYQSTSRMPSDYGEYTVGLSDYEIQNHGTKYGVSDANVFPWLSSHEGEVVEIAVERDQEIAEGDLLYVIDTGEGRAAMTSAQNAIRQENESYQDTAASYDGQITAAQERAAYDGSAAYDVEILGYQKQLAVIAHNSSLAALQENYDRISQGNDGTGRVLVYATEAGTVTKIMAQVGDDVEVGTEMLQLTTRSTDILLVQMKNSESVKVYPDNIADVGERVSVKKDDTVYEGTCIGWAVGTNNLSKGYAYTDEEGAHLSYGTSSGYDFPAFYVRMDDPGFMENLSEGAPVDFSYISMQDVIVLPSGMVYQETDALNDKKVSYYVWRLVDGELVKQYVLIAEDLNVSGKQVVLSGLRTGDVLAQE